jgi:S-layer homology domain
MSETEQKLPQRGPFWQSIRLLATIAVALFGLLLTGSVAFAGLPTKGAQADSPPATSTPDPCALVGVVVYTPPLSSSLSLFNSLAAVSANDIWVAGRYHDAVANANRTLTEHWDGTVWSVVSSPNVGTGDNELIGLAVVSANDVWAVGSSSDGSVTNVLAVHWDGTAWTVSNLDSSVSHGELLAASALSANDVWAVGYGITGSLWRTLVEHWNGTAWLVVSSPNVDTGNNILLSVSAVSASDVWAVGFHSVSVYQTLVEHWDGTAWSVKPSPNVGTSDNILLGASAISANDVWAVGTYRMGSEQRTLTEYWNGTAWSVVASPNPSSTVLNAVTAISATDIWAVGSMMEGTVEKTLVLHWDGATWSVVSSPNNGSNSNQLNAVAAVGAGDLWMAGGYYAPPDSLVLMEHFISPCITPTSTPTLTPASTATLVSTSTSVSTAAATATTTQVATDTPTVALSPTASPTACVPTFEDVHPADWDYPYVQWMFCRGVISGYNTVPPCINEGATCFKPQNNTTRGQVAKIVVLAFDFPIDTTGGPHFSDVAVGSTFYDYIETARNRGLVSGYADGTFRPNNNVTRPQVAKIAVLAAIEADPAHWTLLNPADNTFTDVTQGSTFYEYVETAAAHSVLSGYPCGIAPAGACDPEHKPYFLPDNSATRAQISKIVYMTVNSQLHR